VKEHLERSWFDSREVGGRQTTMQPAKYQCLFCKKHVDSYSKVLAHEQQCDTGIHVRKMWARRLERAKRNYARTGHL